MTLPKFGPLGYSLGLNLVLLAVAIGLGWQLAGAKPKCEAKQEKAVVKADQQQAKDTAKRDHTLDGITQNTKADTGKALAKAEDHTHARAAAINAVRTDGGCRMPAGLPSLDAAVDEANAAAGE
jgi:uncharacterized protein HemX